MTGPFPCAACGFVVFAEPPGSYEICAVCGWEDDFVQLEAPGYAGGANRQSLAEYQKLVALRIAPLGVDVFKGSRRDTSWRPVSAGEDVSDRPGVSYEPDDERVYYWRRSPAAPI